MGEGLILPLPTGEGLREGGAGYIVMYFGKLNQTTIGTRGANAHINS